jgi:nitroimidazol reductase NimA-like FMN-containing flavoprotein (pyridoxamine 5'-phosphate oxidase superfamily)
MRHPERKIRNRETIAALLNHSQIGRMATINRRGVPVIKPVNFIYRDGKIFVHSSLKGEKIRDIRRGSAVCFEVDEPVAYVTSRDSACRGDFYYRSILIQGKAALVNPLSKKLAILEKLMEKYQPEGGYEGISGEILKRTAVIEISIQEMTGKEKLG